MSTTKQIAAALTIAGAFAGNANACGALPTPSEPTLPVTMGVDPDNKLYLSRGIWSIAVGKDNQLNVTSSMKCIMKPEIYEANSAQMKKLAQDACSEDKNVSVTLEEGSPAVTQAHVDKFCKGIGNGSVVYVPK
ncbi:MAG: hypothetical protein A3J37_07805 [Alphaproteobacteria bacterium RIFCSPHIGHO2_12_FULL_45_9]|nr:MAG: hypothetical protein A3B66_09685 [Alphaproteobacteria bacterium RIFCSPHIGHO2_02_FULL_46_13]OFW93996.1 MAG: hypothetical protein A3J37_07805 [Alphaproteobacteria bacterium RIFCSPHIGHO2_12_FULL_45_9]